MQRTTSERPPAAAKAPATAVALVEVVSCDGSDSTAAVVPLHRLGAEVRQFGATEAWFEQLQGWASDPSHEPADLVVMVGAGERMAAQRWVVRGAAAAPTSLVAAALIDATPEQMMSVVNQGARGLLLLPNPADRIAPQLHELLRSALRCQKARRDEARHRRALATLSPAENDVLAGMLAGMPNKQVAQRLKIGLRTVELRRSKIMKKMRAKGLAQLISFVCAAQREGC